MPGEILRGRLCLRSCRPDSYFPQSPAINPSRQLRCRRQARPSVRSRGPASCRRSANEHRRNCCRSCRRWWRGSMSKCRDRTATPWHGRERSARLEPNPAARGTRAHLYSLPTRSACIWKNPARWSGPPPDRRATCRRRAAEWRCSIGWRARSRLARRPCGAARPRRWVRSDKSTHPSSKAGASNGRSEYRLRRACLIRLRSRNDLCPLSRSS